VFDYFCCILLYGFKNLIKDNIVSEAKKEVLVVSSKVKNFIKAKSGLNTSAAVFEVLSAKVEDLCNAAVEKAKKDGRKTVMDRDF